jgi:hypothetical protein
MLRSSLSAFDQQRTSDGTGATRIEVGKCYTALSARRRACEGFACPLMRQRGREHRRTNEANAHLRSVCYVAELGRMRGHTKPSEHAAHSKRRSPTEILHARMPPDAGEAGHGPKSDTHANCGNYEKHGKSRLRASAPWTVNRLRATRVTPAIQTTRRVGTKMAIATARARGASAKIEPVSAGFCFMALPDARKDRSVGGIIRWATRPSTKSPLEKVTKDQQRGHADKPHPILELDADDGVVVEQKFRDLFPHAASLGARVDCDGRA